MRSFLAASLLALALAPLVPSPAAAQRWRASLAVGSAYNLPLPLVIEQAGQPDLSFTAHWDTHALETPVYYVARLEQALDGGGGYAVELLHHKLFLEDPPPEVGSFSISHGFNVFTLQRAWAPAAGWSWRAGAGLVVTHPETVVRGRGQPRGGWLDGGYYVSGPAAQLGGGFSLPAGALRLGVEGKLTGARVWLPVAGGSAQLWHASAHLNLVATYSL